MTDKLPKATHPGELKIGDSVLEVAVLNNGTRVIWQRALYQALGFSRTTGGGEQGIGAPELPRFLQAANINPYISKELRRALTPIQFVPGHGGRTAYGYTGEVLAEICTAYIDARKAGALKKNQEPIADRCEMLLRGFAKTGIIALIDEATGYQEIRDRDSLQKILDKYLRQELAVWAKRFPDEFYEQMFRLRGWQWKGMKVNRPQIVANYTKDLVYERLAPGILAELEARNPIGEKGRRHSKHHQWFTADVGHPALAQHLFAVIGFMRASANWAQFYRMVQRAFPRINTNLELLYPEPELEEKRK